MQKPDTPSAQRAKTTSRCAQIGRRANVAMRWVARPKHGSIATYTSACAKNQNKRCHCAETSRLATAKKCVPRTRSVSRHKQAPNRMLKIRRLKIALMNHAQTETGIRGRVIPAVRESITVTQKFSEVSSDAPQNKATPVIQRVMPMAGG